jgi:hypothetical protein
MELNEKQIKEFAKMIKEEEAFNQKDEYNDFKQKKETATDKFVDQKIEKR